MTAFPRILFCTALGLGGLGLGTSLAGGNFVSRAKANPLDFITQSVAGARETIVKGILAHH
jgi:hypothetical protein